MKNKKKGNLYPDGSNNLPEDLTPPVPQIEDDNDDNKKVKIAVGIAALIAVGIVVYQYLTT